MDKGNFVKTEKNLPAYFSLVFALMSFTYSHFDEALFDFFARTMPNLILLKIKVSKSIKL